MGSKNQFQSVELIGGGLDSKRWQGESESPLEKSEILAFFFAQKCYFGPSKIHDICYLALNLDSRGKIALGNVFRIFYLAQTRPET